MLAIEINHLSKRFGKHYSIQDVNLQIHKGEVFGFVGPNGSGKSTTIRHLMGFLNATEGTCMINGLDCRKEAAKIQKTVGYLPGEIAFMDKMTGKQFIHFIADLRGLNDMTKATELITFFEFDTNRPIKKMSKGMKQKLGLVCAFMHSPDIVVLDEPTSGLDPLMQTKFIELILSEKEKGTTIFMSSHLIEEVEKTCDRVAIINSGQIVAIEEVAMLKQHKIKKYVIEFQSEKATELFLQEGYDVERTGTKQVTVTTHGDLQNLLGTLTEYHVIDFDVIAQSLEDVVMHYYRTGGDA